MKERIKNIIRQYVDDGAIITEETNMIRDLGLTSFDLATMAADFEEEFGINIETSELMDIKTVKDIANCIQKHL